MPYDTPGNNRRSSRSSRGNGSFSSGGLRGSGSSRGRISTPSQGMYHGPVGTQQRSGARRLRGRGSAQTGYPLRSRNINFQSGHNRRSSTLRPIILIALAVVLVVLAVVGVSSCVRGCSAAPEEQDQQSLNQIDSRVAAGVTDDMTRRFATELDRNEKLAQIAANANKYTDAALLDLALNVPEAIDFVASYPDAAKEGQAYADAVSKGTVPELYTWDARWGAVDYGEHPLAISGSGPCALSMAYMGLTGSADKTPADIAAQAVAAGSATGDSGTDAGFFEAHAADLGLAVKSYESSAEAINQVLDAGVYLLMEVGADTITDSAHWILVHTENANGTVIISDPTSPEASSHEWSPATLASACNSFYSVSVAATEEGTGSGTAE